MKLPVLIALLFALLFLPPAQISAATSDEAAMEKMNRSLLPAEVAGSTIPPQKSIFRPFLGSLSSLSTFLGRMFGLSINLSSPKDFANRSEVNFNSSLPEFGQDQKGEILNQPGSIWGRAGIYGSQLPEFSGGDPQSIREFEQAYEQAHFPEGVHPITGQ